MAQQAPPGWYTDPHGSPKERYWDGTAWTQEIRKPPAIVGAGKTLDDEVAQFVSRGYRVESQTDLQAVLVRGRRPNHVLHLILSVLTAGLWAIFVWLPLALFGGEKRTVLSVDGSGRILKA